MSVNDLNDILAGLRPWIFRLHIPVEEGRYGTGFFISKEFALTAFHNLYPSAIDNPAILLSATFRGKAVDFVQALCSEHDRKWQELYDIAVLKAVTPLDASPDEEFYYLDPEWEERDRDLRWVNRNVVATGFPSNSDVVAAIPGMTPSAGPLVDAPRIVGKKDENTIPATLYIISNQNDINAGYGMSGSPVFDKALGGIVGVVVAAKKGFYATELTHLVENWPPAKEFIKNFEPRRHVIAEEVALAKPSWRLRLGIGLLGATIAVGSVFWFSSHSLAPKELEVELARAGTKSTEKVKSQVNAREGEKIRFLITSPTDGYLYIVDREVAGNGALREPYLAFPTLSTGAGHNKVTPGLVVSFPDPSDRSPTIEAKPSHPPDPEYVGELLSILVFENQLPIDHLEAQPIPLTPEEFPDGGERLLFSSEAPAPKAAKKIKLVVLRTSQTPRPEVTRPQ